MLAIILIQTLLLTVLTISGCGGGGGGSSSSVIPGGSGSAILTWDAPTTNTDSTCLTDLAGYKVYYGTSLGDYSNNKTISVNDITCVDTGIDACGNIYECTYTVEGLSSGTWCFAITAYDTSGNYSGYSNDRCTNI